MKANERDWRGRGRPVIYCYELHVKDGHQGVGIGSALLEYLEAITKNALTRPLVMLTCFTASQRTINFYNQHGYELDEISPDPALSDYIILRKLLL